MDPMDPVIFGSTNTASVATEIHHGREQAIRCRERTDNYPNW